MSNKKILAVVIMIAIQSIVFFAQTAKKNISVAKTQTPVSETLPEPADLLFDNIAKNNYLAPLTKLKELETQYQERRDFLYNFSYINSYVGNYANAHAYYDKINSHKLTPDLKSSPIDAYQPLNAKQVIGSIADKEQVIMINEEHDTPMHRAFTTELLPILYAKGFRYFAAETLSDFDEDLNARGYPTNVVLRRTEKGLTLHGTGFYSADPVYGDLIRTALKLGFKVVPYESRDSQPCKPTLQEPMLCQNRREKGQAQNIYDRILRQDPQAKIIVHVGRGHNAEIKGADGWIPMGVYFKDITKIDPFTINQMTMSERSKPEFEDPLYRHVTQKWSIKQPTVFQSKKADYFTIAGTDLLIFHPRSVYEFGRPVWLKIGGWRKAYDIDINSLNSGKTKLSLTKPILVQAFLATENEEAVPVDQILISDWSDGTKLMLPKGKYRIRAINESGEIIARYEFSAT
jgi:hypothetical protein